MKKIVLLFVCLGLFSCGTVRKLLKRGPQEEETVQETTEDMPVVKKAGTFGVLKTSHRFLPSYQDAGGPHLKIDSLSAVLVLSDETLRNIEQYIARQRESGPANSGDGQVIRYYKSNYTADDLLANEISPEKALEGPHFKGVFDRNGNLQSLEFVGEQALERPNVKDLKYLYASYWNLFTNSRINYIDDDGNRPPPHVKFYVDAGKHVHRIDYLNVNKDIIARAEYTYGIKYMILEQRIVMPTGGKLTDLHPDYFFRKYDQVEAGWVIKCLYEQKDRLSELVVMQDDGLVFYRYRFTHNLVRGRRIVEAFVYNSADDLVGRYELYFSEGGELEKKLFISEDRKISAYLTYTIDTENLKVIVDSYDSRGNNVSRIYRDL